MASHHHASAPGWAPLALARPVVALALATVLARRGLRKGSLSRSGAAAAFAVGLTTFAADAVLGSLLIGFYLSSTAFTRYRSAIKARFDLEHRPGGGQRDWTQVLATAGVGTALAARWLARYGLAGGYARLDAPRDPLATALLVASLAAYACANGDTWASELGILSTRDPVGVLTCRRVPRGTNGGVSLWGTLMSAAGGAFIGAVAYAVGGLEDVFEEAFLIDVKTHGGGTVPYATPQWLLVAIGAGAGLAGSLIDSVLGAVLQASYMDVRTGKVTSRLPPGAVVVPAATAAGDDRSALPSLSKGKTAASSSSSSSSAPVEVLDGETNWRRFYREATLSGASSESESESDPGAASSDSAPAASGADGVRRRQPRGGAAPAPASAASSSEAAPSGGGNALVLVPVAGWDVLTNEQVNAVSAALTAAATVWATRALLPAA